MPVLASRRETRKPLGPADDLDGSFAWREERTVTFNLTVQYDRVMFLLEPNDLTRGLARKRVTIYDFPDGRVEIRYNGRSLPYTTFDRVARIDQGPIVENKRLSEALSLCREIQAHIPPKSRSRSAPRRSNQANHIFAQVSAEKPIVPAVESLITTVGAGDRLDAAMTLARQIAAKLPARNRKNGRKSKTRYRAAAE